MWWGLQLCEDEVSGPAEGNAQEGPPNGVKHVCAYRVGGSRDTCGRAPSLLRKGRVTGKAPPETAASRGEPRQGLCGRKP